MIINFKIPYTLKAESWSDEKWADFIMPKFGLMKTEYNVLEAGKVEGAPSAFSLTSIISPIRISVYDVVFSIDKKAKMLTFRIRLYKLYAFSLLIPIFILLTHSWKSLTLAIAVYLLCVLFFFISAIIELIIRKKSITRALNPQ